MYTFILNTRTYDKLFNAVNIADYHKYNLQVLLPHDIAKPANSPEENDGSYAKHCVRKVASCVYALAELCFEHPSKWQKVIRAQHIDEQKLIIIAEDSGETKKDFLPEHFDFSGLDRHRIHVDRFPGPEFKPAVEASGGIQAYHEKWLDYQKNTGEENLDFICESTVCAYRFDVDALRTIWEEGENDGSTLEGGQKTRRLEAIYRYIETFSAIATASIETRAMLGQIPADRGVTLEHIRTPISELGRGVVKSSFELADYVVAISPRQAVLREIFDRFGVEQNRLSKKTDQPYYVRFFPAGAAYPGTQANPVARALDDPGISILPPPSKRVADYKYETRDPAYYFGVNAYILMPPDTTDELTKENLLAKAEYALQLCRIPNLKRIEPRNKNTITILYNPNNEWLPYLDFMYDLYDNGLAGNKPVEFHVGDDIRKMRDHPFAFIASDIDSIKDILRSSRQHQPQSGNAYQPRYNLVMPTQISQSYCVGVFAGHNVESPNHDAEGFTIGNMLAEAEIDLVTGGGDRSVMGALEKGFVSGREDLQTQSLDTGSKLPKLHGSITEFLLTVETTRQGFSKNYDTTYIAPDMSRRKRFFWENCDDFGVIKGAHGAYEELCEAFMLILNDDPVMKNKSIVILDNPFNGGTSFGKLLTLYFGEDYSRNKKELGAFGIHIAESPQEMIDTFVDLRERKMVKRVSENAATSFDLSQAGMISNPSPSPAELSLT